MARIKFGIEMPRHLGFPYLKNMAQTAEKLGYDSPWVLDHPIVSPNEIAHFPQANIEKVERKSTGEQLSCLPWWRLPR